MPLEDRLKSSDPAVVKAAISEVWRHQNCGNIAPAIALLGKPGYMEEAANALCLLNDRMTDNLVLNGFGAGPDSEGRLYYAFLAARERFVSGDTAGSIAKNIGSYTPAGKFYAYMLLSFADKKNISNAIKIFEDGKLDKKKYALRDLLRLIGDAGYAPGYNFAVKAGKKYPAEKAMAVWAQHRIRGKSGIKYDIDGRLISNNFYLKKERSNPVWPTVEGSLRSVHTANPDIMTDEHSVYMYYRSGNGTDRITLATVPYNIFNGKNFLDTPNNPVVDVSKNGFDSRAALDPAAVYFNKKVFLYYSGLGSGDDSVGLATSSDRLDFVKQEGPVLKGRAPEAVLKEGILYLYYVLKNDNGGYSIYLATSADGYKFTGFGKAPVFDCGRPGAWDDKTVTTPRIFENDGVYYMIYAGDNKYLDYPPYFGLAFSYDLIHWIRSTQNPVFSRGKKGQWDDGAIWFGDMFLYKGRWYLYYEGWGGGESSGKEYGRGGHSQIGLATGNFNVEEML
jgi:predicted GH43/DUF377 family glycosyl hydrolase